MLHQEISIPAAHPAGLDRLRQAGLIFYTAGFSGWLWEGLFHLLTAGHFVNRGLLHGPWLPIYGCGALVILLGLRRFRGGPVRELLLAMGLSGALEYGTSWLLEALYGVRWWDYSQYPLNLNGRVCFSGLLLFGTASLLAHRVAGPRVKRLLGRIPGGPVDLLLLGLSFLFLWDILYSAVHPNMGLGITELAP